MKQCVKALSNPAVLLLLAGSALAVSVVHADHAKAMLRCSDCFNNIVSRTILFMLQVKLQQLVASGQLEAAVHYLQQSTLSCSLVREPPANHIYTVTCWLLK